MKKVALLIGHTKEEQGALSYFGETEFAFNSRVASSVARFFTSEEVRVIQKEGNYLGEIERFDPTLLIELHFNAFNFPVYGCEGLSLKASQNANVLLDSFSKRFKIKNRGLKIVTRGDRGYFNLFEARQYESFIFEPCFGNFRTKDSEKIIGDPLAYRDFLVDYISFYLDKTPTINQNILTKTLAVIRSWFPKG